MKTTKLISMLIFLAILSFSCSEDDVDKDVENTNLTDDYQFQNNSKYKYEIEFTVGDTHGNFEQDTKIYYLDVYDFTKFNNKNCLFIHDNLEDTDQYYFYEDTKIKNSFFLNDNNGNLIEIFWIEILNLENDEWVAADYKIERPNEHDIKFSLNVVGKKVKNIDFTTSNGIRYTGIEVKLTYNIYNDYRSSFGDIIDGSYKIERTIHFLKDNAIGAEEIRQEYDSDYHGYGSLQISTKVLMNITNEDESSVDLKEDNEKLMNSEYKDNIEDYFKN